MKILGLLPKVKLSPIKALVIAHDHQYQVKVDTSRTVHLDIRMDISPKQLFVIITTEYMFG